MGKRFYPLKASKRRNIIEQCLENRVNYPHFDFYCYCYMFVIVIATCCSPELVHKCLQLEEKIRENECIAEMVFVEQVIQFEL